MRYQVTVDTTDAEGIDPVGLSATINYVLTTQLAQIPGVTAVVVTEVTTI